MGGPHPIHWGPGYNKKEVERQIHSLCLSWDCNLLLPLDIGSWAFRLRSALTPLALPHATPSSQGFRLRLNFTTSSPDSPTCRWQLVGLLSFHNPKSHEILSLYTYTHTHTHICMFLLVLFLWRTLIQLPITPPLPTHQCHSAQWDLESDSPPFESGASM